jgi:hypothetical protein
MLVGVLLPSASAAVTVTVTLPTFQNQLDRWCAHFEEIQAEVSSMRRLDDAGALEAAVASGEPVVPRTAKEAAQDATVGAGGSEGDATVQGILRIDMEFDTIRSDVPGFTAAFESSVTTALGCSHGRVKALDVREGSIIVSFQVGPGLTTQARRSFELIEELHEQLLDPMSPLRSDPSFGGFAERSTLFLVPLKGEFDASRLGPISNLEVAELQRMQDRAGHNFLQRVCWPGGVVSHYGPSMSPSDHDGDTKWKWTALPWPRGNLRDGAVLGVLQVFLYRVALLASATAVFLLLTAVCSPRPEDYEESDQDDREPLTASQRVATRHSPDEIRKALSVNSLE